MSFTNLSPDISPSGTPIPLNNGIRYFYFMFVAPSSYVDFFLRRNRYRNEEYITRLYTTDSDTSLLNLSYVKNIRSPTTFLNGRIGLSTPSGATYINNTSTPNLQIWNLIPGNVYYLESRTIYNDFGVDFGLKIMSGLSSVDVTYIRTELTSIPFPPLPLPPPPPPPNPTGIPPIPTGIVAQNGTYCVILTWTESIGATSYNLYRSGLFIGRTANLTFMDSHVVSGGYYTYTIRAENENGVSESSILVTIRPLFSFTNLMPDKTPDGINLVGVGVRYYYFLFTPISPSADIFFQFNGVVNQSAIVGIYNTSSPSTNIIAINTSVSNPDTNIVQGLFTLGTAPNPQLTVYGVRFTSIGPYMNTTQIPNLRMNNLTPMETHILEVASVSNLADDMYCDLGIYMKTVGSEGGIYDGYTIQTLFNSISLSRFVPTTYNVVYNFRSTSQMFYSTLIAPNLHVFQNVKNVLESMIRTSPGARSSGRQNDMLVNFTVENLQQGVLGQSALTRWKDDRSRSPDFPYEQDITFNSYYFSNGYFNSAADFNGAPSVNGITNTTLFNTLLHEALHGIGINYMTYYNSTNMNIGWNSFLTNVEEGDPWYRGRETVSSEALTRYQNYCRNSTLLRIPIEKDYGGGTADSHWDEGDTSQTANEKRYFSSMYHPSLRLELMTGFLNKNDYLTGITAGSLKDYGYSINMNSPYVVEYPYSLIPTNALNSFMYIERNVQCICKDGVSRLLCCDE